MFLSLLVILACRLTLGDEFNDWGWRVPFLVSIVLLGISVYIRLQLQESPAFLEIKAQESCRRRRSRNPSAIAQGLRLVLLALLGATAGQAVVWYCGQFYALFFLEKVLQVDSAGCQHHHRGSAGRSARRSSWCSARSPIASGRKPIVLAGCVLAALTYFPVFKALTHYANPALEHAVQTAPITVVARPEDCSFQFDPVGKKSFATACDIAKSALATAGVPYSNQVRARRRGAECR